MLKKENRRKVKKEAQKKFTKNILYNGNDSTLPSNNHYSTSGLNLQKI